MTRSIRPTWPMSSKVKWKAWRKVMATTATPSQNRPRRRSQQPRVSVRAREGQDAAGNGNDHEYDLLTAALIGITIGAGVTYLLRRGPSGRSPMTPVFKGIGRGAN